MNSDKIFVIVPVYKVELYLERCIDSILNQTYKNFELILIDDGSPDNCPAICDRYATKHKNIRVIHQENGGVSAARNAGIEYAMQHGIPNKDWVSFIDSDDFVHPYYLEYLYRAAIESKTEISSCSNIRSSLSTLNISDNVAYLVDIISPENYWCKKFTDATVAWGKLYRLMLYKNIRYPVGRLFEDNFITYKLLFTQEKISVIWTPLYYWFINVKSITNSEWNPSKIAVMDALEEQLLFFQNNMYDRARKQSLTNLFWHSTKQLIYAKHLSPIYNQYIPDLKKRRNRAFRLYSNEVGPVKALSYWYEVRIYSPLKRVLKNESIFSFIKRRINRKFHIK